MVLDCLDIVQEIFEDSGVTETSWGIVGKTVTLKELKEKIIFKYLVGENSCNFLGGSSCMFKTMDNINMHNQPSKFLSYLWCNHGKT